MTKSKKANIAVLSKKRYRVTHSYSNGRIHHWYTDNPEAYLAEVKKEAPLAILIGIEEI